MIIIDKEKCIGCGACVPDCFTRYISLVDGKVEPTGRVCMSCGHCTAVCPTKAITLEGADESEIMEYDKDKFFVDKDNFMNYLKFRRSVRQFEQREVDPKLLAKVLEAGRYTPTGSNYQNVRYIVTSLETTKKLKQMTADFLGNMSSEDLEKNLPDMQKLWPYKMEGDWSVMWRLWKKDLDEMGWDKFYREAPQFILPVCEKGRFSDAFLAMRSIELAADLHGIGTCYLLVATPGISANPEAHKLLGLGPNESIPIVMGIGYHQIKYYRTVSRQPLNWEIR